MSVTPRKWLPQSPAKTPSWWPVAECGNTRRCAPAGDPMHSLRCMAAGLHCIEESGRLSMENDKKGSASPTTVENLEFATYVANNMPIAYGGTVCRRSPTQQMESKSSTR